VTTFYALFLAFVFIVTQIVAAANPSIGWFCTLYYSGAKYTYAIARKGHIHRLFLPLILHASWVHLFWNLLSVFMLGYTVEKVIGRRWKYVLLLVAGGVGGNLVSGTIAAYNIGVGASTSLFALIACNLIWMFRMWEFLGPLKFQMLFFFGIILLFQFLNGFLASSSSPIDMWAHLGGFLFGLALSLLLVPASQADLQGDPPIPNTPAAAMKERRIRLCSWVSLSILTITFTVALFTTPLPLCGPDYAYCDSICSN
jgi:membrane associated rhomboid family serine protease